TTCRLLVSSLSSPLVFSFTDPAPTEIYTLSLHDALPICRDERQDDVVALLQGGHAGSDRDDLPGALVPADDRELLHLEQRGDLRSEEHTSELQSRENLVCRLLLEKKKVQ